MIYKTLTEIRQSELNADCGKGFSRCCLTEQDSYTGRASVPALWESINCEGISIGSLQIMKALIARGWTVIGVEIARTDVEKRATLTLQEGYRRPGLTPPPHLVVKTPSPRATKERQPGIICIERKGWIVPASWSSCGSSPTVVPSRRGGGGKIGRR